MGTERTKPAKKGLSSDEYREVDYNRVWQWGKCGNGVMGAQRGGTSSSLAVREES